MSGQKLMDVCTPDRPDVLTNQGENERGWLDQTWWPLCQVGYHPPYRSLSRCHIHPLAQVDQLFHEQQQLQLGYRPQMWLRLRYGRDLRLVAYSALFLLDFQSLNGLVNPHGISPLYKKVDWNILLAAELLLCLWWSHCALFFVSQGDIRQSTPSRPKKFRQTFLSGCHDRLLYKVKRDPASVPFESRILSTSIEAH